MSGFEINQLAITGNLTRDPELRSLNSGTTVCNIRIAHNERRKIDGEWTTVPQFFDVTIWGAIGAWLAANVAQGQKVVVAGRLSWREYEVDGAKRQAVSITADSVVPVPRSATTTEPADDFAPATAGDDDIPF
jgi:single-strand DNA-binding protein